PDLSDPKIGAITFIQHFGKTLNFHPHFHLIVADGLFGMDGNDILFHKVSLTPDDIADTEDCIRKRVLRYFARQGWFDKETINRMATNENSGFSLEGVLKV